MCGGGADMWGHVKQWIISWKGITTLQERNLRESLKREEADHAGELHVQRREGKRSKAS